MSKLGCIYTLHQDKNGDGTIRRYKQKYPVVYENKSYCYCKQYGADELLRFCKIRGQYYYVQTLEEYLEKKSEYLYNTDILGRIASVWVQSPKQYDFPEYNEITEIELALHNQEKVVENAMKNVKALRYQISCSKQAIKNDEQRLPELEIYYENELKKLEELKKQVYI